MAFLVTLIFLYSIDYRVYLVYSRARSFYARFKMLRDRLLVFGHLFLVTLGFTCEIISMLKKQINFYLYPLIRKNSYVYFTFKRKNYPHTC